MANRNWSNGGRVYTMHVSPTIINTNITIGATGAVVSNTSTSVVTSVTRLGTGIYRLNMAEPFNVMLYAQGSAQSPASGLSGVLAIEIQNAPTAAVKASTLTIKTLDAAGALVDPASGSVISVMAMMNNSSVKS